MALSGWPAAEKSGARDLSSRWRDLQTISSSVTAPERFFEWWWHRVYGKPNTSTRGQLHNSDCRAGRVPGRTRAESSTVYARYCCKKWPIQQLKLDYTEYCLRNKPLGQLPSKQTLNTADRLGFSSRLVRLSDIPK